MFPEEGRPASAWQCLEPVTLPVAWSPLFVLWIRSLFLAFSDEQLNALDGRAGALVICGN